MGPVRCEAGTLLRDERWGTFREQCEQSAGHPGPHAVARDAADPAALLVWTDSPGAPPPRLCGVDCATERDMAYAHGRDEERAAAVAFLAERAGTAIANTIKRCEHRAPLPHLAGGDDDRPEFRDA